MIRAADGQITTVTDGGPLLGVLTDIHIRETTVVLAPGEAPVLFTDGLTEQPDPTREERGRRPPAPEPSQQPTPPPPPTPSCTPCSTTPPTR